MANSTFQERSIMRKIILALLFSLVVTPVFGKVVTMNGVQYQVWIDKSSGEYRMKPVDSKLENFGKPKVTKLTPTGSLLNPPKKVLDREPVKTKVIEKTKTEAVYTEDICDDPMGCPQDVQTGDCPTCKKIKIYEEKLVQKIPSKEKVEHTIIRENEILSIKEGNYSLVEIQTTLGTDVKKAYIHNGLELDVKKLNRNEFYFSFAGGADLVDEMGKRSVISCPKPDNYIISVDNEGNVNELNRVKKGSCGTLKGLASKYSFNGNTLTRVRVTKPVHCHVGCEGNGDVYKTEIHTYRYNSGFNG